MARNPKCWKGRTKHTAIAKEIEELLVGAPMDAVLSILNSVHGTLAPSEPSLVLQRASFSAVQDQIALLNSSTHLTEHKRLVNNAIIMATAPKNDTGRRGLLLEYAEHMRLNRKFVAKCVEHRSESSVAECGGEFYRLKRKTRSDTVPMAVQKDAMNFWATIPEIRNMGSGKTPKARLY